MHFTTRPVTGEQTYHFVGFREERWICWKGLSSSDLLDFLISPFSFFHSEHIPVLTVHVANKANRTTTSQHKNMPGRDSKQTSYLTASQGKASKDMKARRLGEFSLFPAVISWFRKWSSSFQLFAADDADRLPSSSSSTLSHRPFWSPTNRAIISETPHIVSGGEHTEMTCGESSL